MACLTASSKVMNGSSSRAVRVSFCTSVSGWVVLSVRLQVLHEIGPYSFPDRYRPMPPSRTRWENATRMPKVVQNGFLELPVG